MRTLALSVSFLALVLAPCFAQEGPPKPAPELAKFDRMIGNWETKGHVWMDANAEPMEWTAKSRTEKVLDGFALREIMVIDLGEMVPVPMAWHSYMSYDVQTQRYQGAAIANNGRVAMSQIYFADDDTLVSVETMLEEGHRMVDHWVTKLGDGETYTFVGRRSVDGGEFFKHVEGKSTRVDVTHEFPSPQKTASFMVDQGPEMKELNRMAGTYEFKGSVTMGPGAPPMKISGRETLEPWFGGTALVAEVTGDPAPGIGVYKAIAAFGWDDEKDAYVGIYFNNMGELGSSEHRFIDGHLVGMQTGPWMGIPSASRGIISLAEDGTIEKAVSHVLMGTHEPMQMFEATYTRTDG